MDERPVQPLQVVIVRIGLQHFGTQNGKWQQRHGTERHSQGRTAHPNAKLVCLLGKRSDNIRHSIDEEVLIASIELVVIGSRLEEANNGEANEI
jgi:hypothetical protein